MVLTLPVSISFASLSKRKIHKNLRMYVFCKNHMKHDFFSSWNRSCYRQKVLHSFPLFMHFSPTISLMRRDTENGGAISNNDHYLVGTLSKTCKSIPMLSYTSFTASSPSFQRLIFQVILMHNLRKYKLHTFIIVVRDLRVVIEGGRGKGKVIRHENRSVGFRGPWIRFWW